MIKRKILFLLGVILLILGYIYYQVNYTKVEKTNVTSNKFATDDKMKILQISDVHNKRIKKDSKLMSTIKNLDADIIVITGDLIDRETKDFENVYEFVYNLKNINPNIYYIPGNHEWTNRNTEKFMTGLKKTNINILINDNKKITIDNRTINICGIDDPYLNRDNLKMALKGINKNYFTLLLSHSPDIVFGKKDIPVDLILSGHTHGGQVRFPFIGPIVAPGQGFFPKYDKGLFEVGSSNIYIDSGLGNSVLPIRFLNRSQVSLIEIYGTRE
ncbi:metallophosphoesterase [Dethiothermospora halolimnae]|uniref:metallophosphoesterase n=1 Tax=Dethiothermospora halolimnae TaxID=3114390 RepID=UPI003CCC43D8